jgi:hypothetical protein
MQPLPRSKYPEVSTALPSHPQSFGICGLGEEVRIEGLRRVLRYMAVVDEVTSREIRNDSQARCSNEGFPKCQSGKVFLLQKHSTWLYSTSLMSIPC